jgi:hypothetical protein
MGYEYCLWLVPFAYHRMIREYGMKHIPHVTIKANLSFDEALYRFWIADYKYPTPFIRCKPGGCVFPPMYSADEAIAYGFYATASIPIQHPPHLTMAYNELCGKNVQMPPGTIHCFVAVADCRDDDPSKWTLYPS